MGKTKFGTWRMETQKGNEVWNIKQLQKSSAIFGPLHCPLHNRIATAVFAIVYPVRFWQIYYSLRIE